MNTEQMIDQLNDIHNGLAKMDLSSGVYQYFSEKLVRVKEALAKNLPQAAVSGSLPRFSMPSGDHLVKIAILFNDGKLDKEQLSAMVGMCQFVLDRIQENDDVTLPSSKEESGNDR